MQIVEVPITRIAVLAEISIAFEARSTLEISPSPEARGEFLIRKKPLWTGPGNAAAGNLRSKPKTTTAPPSASI